MLLIPMELMLVKRLKDDNNTFRTPPGLCKLITFVPVFNTPLHWWRNRAFVRPLQCVVMPLTAPNLTLPHQMLPAEFSALGLPPNQDRPG